MEGVRCAGRRRRLSRSSIETASHRGKARRQGERGAGANGAINSRGNRLSNNGDGMVEYRYLGVR